MKILFAGKSDFTYNRDHVLISGLSSREDVEIHKYQIKKRNWKAFSSIRNLSQNVDFVFVPSFRHKDLAFIKMASLAPVIFDPLISKYMTRVLDYGVKWKGPHKYLVDKMSYFWADILIWDSAAHQNYLVNKYKIRKPNTPIYIGVDTQLFYPISDRVNDKIVVGFYGSFNPLQGIDKIVEAAHILRDSTNIEFRIIGSGSTYGKVRSIADKLLLKNLVFLPNVPYEELNNTINDFDICLGVFGDSLKTDVVIPNKIYHYAAANKSIITKDTPAIREIFTHDKNIVLVENSANAIAAAIGALAHHPQHRMEIAESAYALISGSYNQDKIAESLVSFLQSLE